MSSRQGVRLAAVFTVIVGVLIPDSKAQTGEGCGRMPVLQGDDVCTYDSGCQSAVGRTNHLTFGMPDEAAVKSIAAVTGANPKDICRQIKAHVQYAPDTKPEDEWRPAGATLKLGRGDCEDFAGCVVAVCRAKGMLTRVYVLTSKVNERSHAVTIGEQNGGMWMSSNGIYQAVLSLDDAKDKVCREMGWWYDDVTMKLDVH